MLATSSQMVSSAAATPPGPPTSAGNIHVEVTLSGEVPLGKTSPAELTPTTPRACIAETTADKAFIKVTTPSMPDKAPMIPSGWKAFAGAQALDFSDTIIYLKLNPAPVTLHVHEKVLCKSSKFFQTALKKEWDASRKDPKVIDLSDDKANIVHFYIQWLYTGRLPFDPVDVAMVESYNFGDKIMDKRYKNVILEKMMDMQIPTRRIAAVANDIYNGTVPSSLARQLIANIIADSAQKGDEWSWVIGELEKEPLADAMKVMMEVRRAPLTQGWRIYKGRYLEEEDDSAALD